MRVIGKVELDRKHLGDDAEGIVAQKVGLDLKIYDDEGELDNEEVIAAGLAWKTRFGFKNEAGEEVVLFEGKGAQEKDGQVARFTSGPAKGKSKPNPGYTLEGAGISALEHSNGFRMVANFKKQEQGYYTAFGEIEGAGTATFKGSTFRVGRARPRRGRK